MTDGDYYGMSDTEKDVFLTGLRNRILSADLDRREARIFENHGYNMEGLREVAQGNAVATATFLGFHGT